MVLKIQNMTPASPWFLVWETLSKGHPSCIDGKWEQNGIGTITSSSHSNYSAVMDSTLIFSLRLRILLITSHRQLIFKILFICILCAWLFCLCVCKCKAHRSQKWALELLELELPTVFSCHASAVKWTRVLCKSNQCFQPLLSHLSILALNF